MVAKQLSKADSKVLAQVFDPESAPGRAEVIVDPDLPSDPRIDDLDLLQQLKTREKEAISFIEQFEKAPGLPNGKEIAYRQALAILDELVASNPDYASARNNRAQLRRWRFGDRNTLCQKPSWVDHVSQTAALDAVQDLRTTIALATPKRQQDAVSPAQGRLLAQAYTQLGAIYFASYKDLEADAELVVAPMEEVVWAKDRFEDEAAKQFYLGGLYGNEVAKALAVHTNPHAKLCGSIVKEAMRKELAAAQ